MKTYNINWDVIIYPSKKGWDKIHELVKAKYNLTPEKATAWIKNRKTPNGGYKEQLWTIMDELHDMFYMGTQHFKHMNIDLCPEEFVGDNEPIKT